MVAREMCERKKFLEEIVGGSAIDEFWMLEMKLERVKGFNKIYRS